MFNISTFVMCVSFPYLVSFMKLIATSCFYYCWFWNQISVHDYDQYKYTQLVLTVWLTLTCCLQRFYLKLFWKWVMNGENLSYRVSPFICLICHFWYFVTYTLLIQLLSATFCTRVYTALFWKASTQQGIQDLVKKGNPGFCRCNQVE